MCGIAGLVPKGDIEQAEENYRGAIQVPESHRSLADDRLPLALREPPVELQPPMLRLRNDWRIPEEINRVLTDRVSDLLFTASPDAADNLLSEGIPRERIVFAGNVMIDTAVFGQRRLPGGERSPDGWNGAASKRIVAALASRLKNR